MRKWMNEMRKRKKCTILVPFVVCGQCYALLVSVIKCFTNWTIFCSFFVSRCIARCNLRTTYQSFYLVKLFAAAKKNCSFCIVATVDTEHLHHSNRFIWQWVLKRCHYMHLSSITKKRFSLENTVNRIYVLFILFIFKARSIFFL